VFPSHVQLIYTVIAGCERY